MSELQFHARTGQGRQAYSTQSFGEGARVDVDASKSVNRNEEFDCRIDVDVDVVVKQVRPSVSFSCLRVRKYEVTLGDNPSVSSGAPLSLLWWWYDPREKVSSLEYRIRAGESPLRPRRSKENFWWAADVSAGVKGRRLNEVIECFRRNIQLWNGDQMRVEYKMITIKIKM